MGLSSLINIYRSVLVLIVAVQVQVVFVEYSLISMAEENSSRSSSNSTVPKDMSTSILIRVDQSGKGDYIKIQDAIDSVPVNNTQLVFIWLKPGLYREKIVVPADKPYVTLSGKDATNTIITWNDGGDIYTSPTVSILASDFVGRYITIQNSFGRNDKAVAVRVSGDRAAFYACRITSYQDTLLDDVGRHYFSNCYIEGAVDFICGNGASLYEKCHLHSIAENVGAITAQQRNSPTDNSGYTFLGCKLTGIGTTVLGRPWGSYARVIFAYTYMSTSILPQGWNDWDDPTKQSTSYFGEFKCYGPGADIKGRVNWSHVLSDDEVAPFLTKNMIGGRGWLRPLPVHFKTLGGSLISNLIADGAT